MGLEKNQNNGSFIAGELNAYKAQNKLFEILLNMTSASSADEKALKATMKEALKVATEVSGADSGSLFLLDENGFVTENILSRGDVGIQKKDELIGSVLEKGLAGWVKKHLEVGLIKDTKTDSRWHAFSNQPYVARSALAIPIIRHECLFGILTLLHPEVEYFNEDMVLLVQVTADQMAVALENALLYSKLEVSYYQLELANETVKKYSEALRSELKKGQKIQQEFFPYKIPEVKGCAIAAYFHPALQLSGDFYDIFLMPGNRLGVVLADVSDKGVGSALFMALSRSLIRIFSGHFHCYNSIAERRFNQITTRTILSAVTLTNDYIALEHGDEGMFVTLFFGVLELSTGVLCYVNAGHEPLMIVENMGIKKHLKATGPAMGIASGLHYEPTAVQLQIDDILLGVTDGVTEARSPENKLYSRTRLETAVKKNSIASAQGLIDEIKNDLSLFTENAEQADDITMIAVQKNENQPALDA